MKTQFINYNFFVFTLVIIFIIFGVQDISYAQNLDVGEPRTVRMIYFLPNDLPYRADVVQKMKDEIRTVQNFYAEQMQAHGYGNKTFRFETDDQSNPRVHRVNGKHPFSHYDNTLGTAVIAELEQTFDLDANIYFIVLGAEALRQGNGLPAGGVANQRGKNGGTVLVPNGFGRFTVAHELGHTFGLGHDFRDNSYIMSYGHRQDVSLSACAAEFLTVSPHINPRIPITEGQSPTIELISSPTYPAGSKSVPVRLKVKDSEGIHQVQLLAWGGLQECRGLAGKKEAVVEFEYDGGFGVNGFTSLPDTVVHSIYVRGVDRAGNMSGASFSLAEILPNHIAPLEGHTDRVLSVAFSPDRKILASGSWDNTVKLWDVTTKEKIDTFRHVRRVKSVAFSPNGIILASGGNDAINLWDMTTKEKITTLRHGDFVNSVSFSRDGTILASGGDDWTIKLWNVATRKKIATLRHGYYVKSVSFSRDGTILASGAWDGTIKLWDVQAETEITTLKNLDGINAVLFSPDGTTFVSVSTHGTIKLWDVQDIQAETEITTFEHPGSFPSVAFSHDGATLASGTLNGSIKLWDIEKETEIATFGYPSGITSLAFSYDGTTLATGTEFGKVKLWDVTLPDRDVVISIPDPNLASEIRKNLGVPPGVAITRLDMLKLKVVDFTNGQITDLTGLEHAINLRSLALSNQQIRDITPLTELSKLNHLFLAENLINNIAPLAGLTSLQRLDLRHNQINDITPLAGLTKLRHLDISGNQPEINDITPLAGLTNLENLCLYQNKINDITPLMKMTKLRLLNLWLNQINDITPLAGLTNLWFLDIVGNQINDITPLAGLTNLQHLAISGKSISDISLITKFTQLKSLSLGGIPIKDATFLTEMTELETLRLPNCQINEIGLIARLTQLQFLDLQDNQISNVRPLANLLNLKSLWLGGNPIKNRGPLLTLLRKNPDVKIYLKHGGDPLPVTLSDFQAKYTDTGVILKWTTESELNNAGFYIYRSETKDGEFKVLNSKLIQGAGTTGERNNYTWTDTTAKPNTVYYYRIEDVSHAGVRQQLATVRLRGLVSASGKLITSWGDVKMQE